MCITVVFFEGNKCINYGAEQFANKVILNGSMYVLSNYYYNRSQRVTKKLVLSKNNF